MQQFYTAIKECKNLNYYSITELNDDLKFIQLMEKMKGKYAFRTLSGWLLNLQSGNRINNPHFLLKINLVEKINKINKVGFIVKELAKKYSISQNEQVNQTLYIPIKIQSKLINECIKVIEEKRHNLTNIMNCLEEDYLLYEKF